MKTISFLLTVVLLFAGSAFSQNVNAIVDHYIKVKNGLVESDYALVKENVSLLKTSVEKSADFDQKKSLTKAIVLMETAKDLENQRVAFAGISKLMWMYVQEDDQVEPQIYYMYCPMKKRYWLSKEKEIRNPYYGKKMLNCGNVDAKLK